MSRRIRHFVGKESSYQIAFIDDLHTLGLNEKVQLPELVVVGDQNTGKSSVLQAITEISFPVESSVCTRFPIKISFRQTRSSDPSTVKASIHTGRISEADTALRDRIEGFSIDKDELTPEAMEEIVQEATRRIFGDEADAGQSLSDATLRIERSGPNEMNWTIVDLPGLIQDLDHTRLHSENLVDSIVPLAPRRVKNSKLNSPVRPSNAKIAESLVRMHLQNERSIILVVIDWVDIQRHQIVRLIKDIPDLEDRSIGVLTKCDMKQETSDKWMINLMQNDMSSEYYLTHGWFALRNRKPKESEITDDERDDRERDEFEKPEWVEVPKNRTGIASLVEYIDRARRTQVQKDMPQIIEEVRKILVDCETEIKKRGQTRDSPAAQRLYIWQICNEMTKMADGALNVRYQDIPSDNEAKMLRQQVRKRLNQFAEEIATPNISPPFGIFRDDLVALRNEGLNPEKWEKIVLSTSNVYASILKEDDICQGTNLPGDIDGAVRDPIFRQQSVHWGPIARRLIDDVKDLVTECNKILLEIAIPEKRTRYEMSRLLVDTFTQWSVDTDVALEQLLEENQKRPPFTLNPTFLVHLNLLNQQRDEILGELISVNPTGQEPDEERARSRAAGSVAIPERRSNPGTIPGRWNRIFQIRAELEVYYWIALHRFVDNVALQVVERHILGPKCPIRALSAEVFAPLSEKELNIIAGEDSELVHTRAKLEATRSRCTEALAKWEKIRVL